MQKLVFEMCKIYLNTLNKIITISSEAEDSNISTTQGQEKGSIYVGRAGVVSNALLFCVFSDCMHIL